MTAEFIAAAGDIARFRSPDARPGGRRRARADPAPIRQGRSAPRAHGGDKALKRVFFQSAFCAVSTKDPLSKAFYDRNLVNITTDIIKKYGVKVGPVKMKSDRLKEQVIEALAYLGHHDQDFGPASRVPNGQVHGDALHDRPQFLDKFGSFGRYAGEFVWPHSVALGRDGALYVSEVHTGMRVQKFVRR